MFSRLLRRWGEQADHSEDAWANFEETLRKGGVPWGKRQMAANQAKHAFSLPGAILAAASPDHEVSGRDMGAGGSLITSCAPRMPIWAAAGTQATTTDNARHERSENQPAGLGSLRIQPPGKPLASFTHLLIIHNYKALLRCPLT